MKNVKLYASSAVDVPRYSCSELNANASMLTPNTTKLRCLKYFLASC